MPDVASLFNFKQKEDFRFKVRCQKKRQTYLSTDELGLKESKQGFKTGNQPESTLYTKPKSLNSA